MTILSKEGVWYYKERFGLETFVETGCWKGMTLAVVNELDFKNVYSCDINKEYVDLCRERFPDFDVRHESSQDFISRLIKEENLGRTLFWLDAHFPGYYGHTDEPDTRAPLMLELESIQYKPGIEFDVIMCDDIANIDDPKNPVPNGHVPQEFKITEYTIDDLVEPFRETHYIKIADNTRESLLVLEPKNR